MLVPVPRTERGWRWGREWSLKCSEQVYFSKFSEVRWEYLHKVETEVMFLGGTA